VKYGNIVCISSSELLKVVLYNTIDRMFGEIYISKYEDTKYFESVHSQFRRQLQPPYARIN
jgi:hypothetical protein